jgi:hypothetical protein
MLNSLLEIPDLFISVAHRRESLGMLLGREFTGQFQVTPANGFVVGFQGNAQHAVGIGHVESCGAEFESAEIGMNELNEDGEFIIFLLFHSIDGASFQLETHLGLVTQRIKRPNETTSHSGDVGFIPHSEFRIPRYRFRRRPMRFNRGCH